MTKTLVIAEAGTNHNGSVRQAKPLVGVAKEVRADVVKFQTVTAQNVVTGQASKVAAPARPARN